MNSVNISAKKCEAYRSIPTAYPRKNLFDKEINTGDEQDRLLDWANATSGISHVRSSNNDAKDTWYKYGDQENFNDFLFDKVDLPLSRFTDGSFPVWYGAEDERTSLLEIEFHLKNDVLSENKQGYIVFERAMCLANLDMSKNADARYLKDKVSSYENKSSYSQCVKEFSLLKSQGATSLTYCSARNKQSECYAVTQKDEIVSSSVIKFYKMIVYSDPNKDTDVTEIILEE